MTHFSSDDIRHLGTLAKMKLTDAEVQIFQKEINAILQFVNTLDQVDVAHVQPLYQLNGAHDRVAEDIVVESTSVQDIRTEFPEMLDDGHLVVPAVFTEK